MLSASISFEEIITDLNSANPTSAIPCFASFTSFSIVAKGSRNITVIRHLKLKCLTHKMINFKIERF